MRIRMNPLVKKELQVSSRSMRLSWGLFAYEGILTVAFLLAMAVIQIESSSLYNTNNIYNYLIYLFPVVSVVQVCIVALIVPIITASSISGEKERQTFEIMMTTCMSPFSIVFGKVLVAVFRILFFVAASTPIMALSFVVGGLHWSSLFLYVLAVILFSLFSGSIGILCSSFCKKSITSVILSFAIYVVVYGMTFLPLIIRLITGGNKAGESILMLLFNPILFFVEFYGWLWRGSSVMEQLSFTRADVGVITYYLAGSGMWIYVSAACILGLSFVFMLIAAWKINPMNAGGRPRKKVG